MGLAHVTIAAQSSGAATQPGTVHAVTFDGEPTVTIPAWSDVVSDPVDMTFAAWQPLSISVYAPGSAGLPTEHFNANATSYYSPPFAGDHTTDATGTQLSQRTTAIPFVSGLDVLAPGNVSTIVAFGDSITDGYVASTVIGIPQDPNVVDRNVRYPDFLQGRLDAASVPFTVLNAGISGNRLTRAGAIPQFGPAGLDRVQRDVIDRPGVTDAIVLEGINDLGLPIGASYDDVVAGYTDLITRLHTAGIAVHLATVLPASNALSDGILTLPNADATRQRINTWIRAQNLSDTVIDLDAPCATLPHRTPSTQLWPALTTSTPTPPATKPWLTRWTSARSMANADESWRSRSVPAPLGPKRAPRQCDRRLAHCRADIRPA